MTHFAPLPGNVFPLAGSSGNYLIGTSNGLTWSNPTYEDDHLKYAGGITVYKQHELRQQHPALLEAWENYLAILYLCNDQ